MVPYGTSWVSRVVTTSFGTLRQDAIGLALALVVFSAWLVTLAPVFLDPSLAMPSLLFTPSTSSSAVASRCIGVIKVFAFMVLRTWLNTGLFVTLHDALHHQVTPHKPRLNHMLGTVLAKCYASFSYTGLYRYHWRHHAAPCGPSDPDYFGPSKAFWPWLGAFLKHYASFWQLFWESFQFWTMVALGRHVFGAAFGAMAARVALFWAIPAVLSGIQLFYFGTYLPHTGIGGSRFKARSTHWPYLLSLVTCFHFGAYHEEHHAFPSVPWWGLPFVRIDASEAEHKAAERDPAWLL